MKVHLIDGTYELYRHFFALPSRTTADGREVAATVGVLNSLLGLVEEGATHIAVATDHVIESFRNDLWPGYKSGHGIEPTLWSQFHLLEDALRSLGFVVWAMVETEADDGLGAGAHIAAADARVEQVVICTPDKDLAQCVVGQRVVQLDRRRRFLIDADGVVLKYGVPPASIPDYLALVGDAADGYPGIAGFGAKSAGVVLSRFGQIEAIPTQAWRWGLGIRGAEKLATTLSANRDLALLFKRLATLDFTAPVSATVDELCWSGPTSSFAAMCAELGAPQLVTRAEASIRKRSE